MEGRSCGASIQQQLQGWMANLEEWVATLAARPLATAALLVRIQTSLKNHTYET